VTDEVRAADRLRWIGRTMSVWLLAIVLLVVAATVGISWTLGVFSSSSSNPQNVASAGSMSQVNSAGNEAFMSATGMIPGDDVVGSVSIRNAGDARGDFRLSVDDVQDVPGPGGGALSGRLRLTVSQGGRKVYNGPLDGLDVVLGTWEPEEERSYRFRVRLPEGEDAVDNPFQRSSVTATFVWDAIQAH